MKTMYVLLLLGMLLTPASLILPPQPPSPTSNLRTSSQRTDPCGGSCAVNAVCVSDGHVPFCSCLPGYSGSPFTECTQEGSLECTGDSQCLSSEACLINRCVDPCVEYCGLYSDCQVANHKPVCACIRGYYLNVTSGCQPIAITHCKTNSHCSKDQACVKETCSDPCVGSCGHNTQCRVRNHTPSCACKPGYTGDPFTQCEPLCLPLLPSVSKKGTKKYFIVNEKLTVHDASIYCQTRGMQLASIESEEENNLVMSLLTKDEFYHTSGHLLRDPWIFYWTSTGREVKYSNWMPDDPSGADSLIYSCIQVTKAGWNNYKCMDNQSFICQYFE